MKENLQELRPFLSVLLVIGTLLGLVFFQMEERRLGYGILKLTQHHRKVIEEKRVKTMMLAKVTRPQHVEKVAQSKFTLRRIRSNQIIYLSGSASEPVKGSQ
ncbi:MAG: histidine kinase [Proteobacteria bacterium]|jgi:hypothetical protein|nr:histidine kinase [Pseudomonadota bacterium]